MSIIGDDMMTDKELIDYPTIKPDGKNNVKKVEAMTPKDAQGKISSDCKCK